MDGIDFLFLSDDDTIKRSTRNITKANKN